MLGYKARLACEMRLKGLRLSYRISARLIISRLLILLGIGMIAYYYGTSVYTYLAQDQLRDRWQDLKIAEKGSSQSPESAEPVNAAQDMLDLFGRLVKVSFLSSPGLGGCYASYQINRAGFFRQPLD